VALIAKLFEAHRAWGMAPDGSAEEAAALAEVTQVVAQIDAKRAAESADPDLGPAGKQVLATLDHEWKGLVAFLGYPGLPLENNAAEVRHEVARYEWTRRKEGRLMMSTA